VPGGIAMHMLAGGHTSKPISRKYLRTFLIHHHPRSVRGATSTPVVPVQHSAGRATAVVAARIRLRCRESAGAGSVAPGGRPVRQLGSVEIPPDVAPRPRTGSRLLHSHHGRTRDTAPTDSPRSWAKRPDGSWIICTLPPSQIERATRGDTSCAEMSRNVPGILSASATRDW